DEFGIQRNKRRGGVGRTDRNAAVAIEQRMFPVHALWGVSEAGIAASPVARQAIAVIQAARILRYVAAQRASVPDLRSGDPSRCIRQHAVIRADSWAALDLGQRRQGTDFDTIRRFTYPLEFREAADVDDSLGALDA